MSSAKRSFPKQKGKYSPPKSAIVNVAGEVFVLNTNLQKFYDLSGSYDQTLKGDAAFDEFFLAVFDTMNELKYEGKTKNISDPQSKKDIKRRAIDIFMNLFGVNMFLQQGPVKVPCSAEDNQILLQCLLFRRDLLIDQIDMYNNVSRSDMRARYLRDHLMFLNKLIEKDIPGMIGPCEDLDALLAGRQGAQFGNLDDDKIKELLNIFAFLIAQGRDPLQFFESTAPIPLDVLPKIALKNAPTLQKYEGQLSREGEDVGAYVQQKFTPTMRKVRDIIYGTDVDTELARLEDSFGIPSKQQVNKSTKQRIDDILKEKENESKKLASKTEDCYKELTETQEISIAVIEKLQKEIELKGSVKGMLKLCVDNDITIRKIFSTYYTFDTLYRIINDILAKKGIVGELGTPGGVFDETFIKYIDIDFTNLVDENDMLSNYILEILGDDETIDKELFLNPDYKDLKIFYTFLRQLALKHVQTITTKIRFDKEILDIYTDNLNTLLPKIQNIDMIDVSTYSKQISDAKTDIDKLASSIYETIGKIKTIFETNRSEFIKEFNTLHTDGPIDQRDIFDLNLVPKVAKVSRGPISAYYITNYLNIFNQSTVPYTLNEIPGIPLAPKVANQPLPELDLFKERPIGAAAAPTLDQNFNHWLFNDKPENQRDKKFLNILTNFVYNNIKTAPDQFSPALLKIKKIEKLFYLAIKQDLFKYNYEKATSFYKKLKYVQSKIDELFEGKDAESTDILKQKSLGFLYALIARYKSESSALTILLKSCVAIQNIAKPTVTQGGGARKSILSPKVVKQMIRQMKDNVLSGEVLEEEDNLESLMEIYGEETVDTRQGLCSLSMLFLLLEVNIMKQNMDELHDTIHLPLASLQKDKAFEFLQDFFSSFQDLDHSAALTFQLKQEITDIPQEATHQAKELLSSMFAIEKPTKQYANEFITFLQVTRTILEENSHILEELGCLIPT